jgi:outer membrane protein assembly factor BamB
VIAPHKGVAIDATTQGPVVFNGRVYVFTNAGNARSFDAATGAQRDEGWAACERRAG